jgi:hypothetical protein
MDKESAMKRYTKKVEKILDKKYWNLYKFFKFIKIFLNLLKFF